MKTSTGAAIAGLLLVGGAVGWLCLRGTGPGDANRPSPHGPTPSGNPTGIHSSNIVSPPPVRTERDGALVFQRAFWRRPAAGDRVLHGERTEWLDAGGAVRRWQWFVAVAPSPEFLRWLLEENPFELTRAAGVTTATPGESPPPWFPAVAALQGLARYRRQGGQLEVFHDAASNRIYARDAGAGFADAIR